MTALRWVTRTVGELLITVGLLLLLFVTWQLWWTDVTANREQAVTIQALERGFLHDDAVTRGPLPEKKEPLATLTDVPLGKAFAIVRIPRFGAGNARPALAGTGEDTLTKGIGHYSGTAMPGQVGNFAVAGHRTTYGRPFHNIDLLKKGDFIVVETQGSYIVYAVDRHVIVDPNQVEVIAPVPEHPGLQPTQAWMTMTSCHPKFSARQRYVVFAKLLKSFPRARGLPASFMAVPSGAVG
jgi:sortase A